MICLCIFIINPLLCSGLSCYLGCCRLLMLLVKCCQNYYFKEAQRKTYIVDVFSLLSSRKYQVQNKNYRIIEGYIYIFIYWYLFNTLTLRVMFLESCICCFLWYFQYIVFLQRPSVFRVIWFSCPSVFFFRTIKVNTLVKQF